MNKDSNSMETALLNGKPMIAAPNVVADKPSAPKKNKVLAKKRVAPAKTAKAAVRASGTTAQLVCRYCGSDDLAPSFIQRREARCRACFKRRYGATRTKPAAKTRAAK